MKLSISLPVVYVLFDWLASVFSWIVFFMYRKKVVIPSISIEEAMKDHNFWVGVVVIPLCWIMWYYFSGAYHFLRHKSLLSVTYETAFTIFSGSTIILLFILVDDDTLTYIPYIMPFIVLLSITFSAVWTIRMSILTIRNYHYRKGRWTKNTLIVEDNTNELLHLVKPYNATVQTININNLVESQGDCKKFLEVLLFFKNPKSFYMLKNEGYRFSEQVLFKVPAELAIDYHSDHHFEYYHDPDFFIYSIDPMPIWQKNFKRIGDIILSILGFVILLPILAVSAYRVWRSSPGSIFFTQLRAGKNGRLFEIIKLRSMYIDSEENGPLLSYSGDDRCTPWGKFMRRYRIDEIPQLWNVIKGDMSIVGPRPERPFFLSQLLEYSDQLKRIYSVRPGITSWGQVKYGYASNISQMLKRLKFDLLYLDNRSVYLDIRIMFSTLAVILKGEGK